MSLLVSAGIDAHTDADRIDVDLALYDLTRTSRPFPDPENWPTLALVSLDEDQALGLIHAGYRGILRPEADVNEIVSAIKAVYRGEIWAERSLLARALDPRAGPSLTPRERETLRHLAKGMSNRSIAENMDIKVGTVKMHVSRLLAKFSVRSRTELMARLRRGDDKDPTG